MGDFWRGLAFGISMMFGIIFSNFHMLKTWDTRKNFEQEAVLNKAGKYITVDGGKKVHVDLL